MSAGFEAVQALLAATPEEAEAVLGVLSDAAVRRLEAEWPGWRHDGQAPPAGDWRVWLMMAGRGFGKTRAGAEWVLACVRDPVTALGVPGPVRVALVAATPGEARRVMIEGPSGVLARARRGEEPVWEPSRGRIGFANGSEAFVYSGAHPDALRGPEHHIAWCDELAKWAKPQASWDNLQLGLRLGVRPRALVTTTPRPIAALTRLIGGEDVVVTRGATRANPHVAPAFVAAMEREHGGTRLGRQELEGELIADVEGSLWPRGLIERCRVSSSPSGEGVGGWGVSASARSPDTPHPNPSPEGEGLFRRIVVGVDPPAGEAGDACGIVVAGVDEAGVGHVLADASVQGLSPEGWARRVADTAEIWGADRVIAEVNTGGAMVTSVLRAAGVAIGVTGVHATRGKARRAEPVAALFETGRAFFAGRFPELEDQLTGLTTGGAYVGPGRSPDRADACVWALTALMLTPRAEPRVLLI